VPLPKLNASEKTITVDGFSETYWVKVLNAPEFDAALTAAKIKAHESTANYSEIPKGLLYDAQLEQITALTDAEQITYAAQGGMNVWAAEAETQYPIPFPPKPSDAPTTNPADFDALLDAHDKEVLEAEKAQDDYVTRKLKEVEASIALLPIEKRLQICMRNFRETLLSSCEWQYQNAEILSRAYRETHNHRDAAFTPEEYFDFTEPVKTALLKAYREVDTVTPTESPT
jgi:hypothetical protein